MAYYKNEILLKSFGKHLKSIRLQRGYTQESLSYDAELDISQIGRIERGQVNISLKKIESICKALDIQPKDLFDFELRNEEIQP